MTIQTADVTTAGQFLFGPQGSTVIAESLEEHVATESKLGGVATVSRVGLHAVVGELCASLDELLDLDLGDLLASGWSSYDALMEAGKRTAANPESSEVVELGRHTITSTHHPSIDILADGVLVATLVADLTLTFDIHAVVAVVRGGYLVAARPSECDLSAGLSWNEFKYEAPKRRIQLPGELTLGDGFRLAPSGLSPRAWRWRRWR